MIIIIYETTRNAVCTDNRLEWRRTVSGTGFPWKKYILNFDIVYVQEGMIITYVGNRHQRYIDSK